MASCHPLLVHASFLRFSVLLARRHRASSIDSSYWHLLQNNHTYQKSSTTAAKKPSHTLQPTPVFSAIRSILFMVPRNRTLVLSKELFMVSASLEESRISSPIATVI